MSDIFLNFIIYVILYLCYLFEGVILFVRVSAKAGKSEEMWLAYTTSGKIQRIELFLLKSGQYKGNCFCLLNKLMS